MVAFTYGLFILHDLVFLIVVGADLLGRLAMAALTSQRALEAIGEERAVT